MSKKSGKPEWGQPQSCKNNPNGKRKDSKIDWSSYNKARRSEICKVDDRGGT